jgi:hypothetical protein
LPIRNASRAVATCGRDCGGHNGCRRAGPRDRAPPRRRAEASPAAPSRHHSATAAIAPTADRHVTGAASEGTTAPAASREGWETRTDCRRLGPRTPSGSPPEPDAFPESMSCATERERNHRRTSSRKSSLNAFMASRREPFRSVVGRRNVTGHVTLSPSPCGRGAQVLTKRRRTGRHSTPGPRRSSGTSDATRPSERADESHRAPADQERTKS